MVLRPSVQHSVKDGVQTDCVVATTADTYTTEDGGINFWILPASRPEFRVENGRTEHFSVSEGAFWGIQNQLYKTFDGSFDRSTSEFKNETYATSPVISAIDEYGISGVVHKLAKGMTNHIRMQVAQTPFDTRLLGGMANLTLPLNSTKTP